MVVSESESEVLSDSESQPMSEHQSASDGALVDLPITPAQGLNIKQELIQSDSERKELDPEVLKKGTETNDREHSQNCTEPKNPEKNEAAGDDVNRPLVLEERHSLSIAETKKRRASIYSNELLFIPKELARSELQQRTRTLSRYAKNREYHLRMLKFPVGSGRPRYVAEQMKKARACEQPDFKQALDESQMSEDDVAIKQEEEIIDEVHEELQDSSDSPQNMPVLEVEGGVKNQLPDDEEISNILFDLVKQEVEENEALEEFNRKILQSQRQSVIRTTTSRLQHYPYLRWHKLDHDVLDSNTGLETPCIVKTEPEVPEIYSEFPLCENFFEVSGDFNRMEERVEDVQEQELEKEPQLPDGQDEPLQSQFQITEPINYLPQCEAALQMQLEQQQLLAEVPANNSTAAAPRSPGIGGQATNSVLRQHLIHHIVQPNTLSEDLLQSNSCNNNADDRINQNLRQPQFLESSFPSEMWNVPGIENYTDQAFHNQQLHLQQQYLYSQQLQQQQLQLQQQQLQQQQQQQQQHQQRQQQQQQEQHQQQHQQQQQQQLILYHQHQHKIEDKVQEMRLMYQRIKCREEEQLNQYGKSLKKIQEDRLACERRHAEEKRIFLLKMDESRKLEEKLKSEKEQLLRQLRSDLRTLELRIAEQQRQQEEKALAWSWQHQQQQLQLQRHQLLAQQQSQPQQPHFLHHQHHSPEVEAPQGQYKTSQPQPNQEQYTQHHQIVNQQHTLLYDPPPYIFQPAYQESNVYQQRLQAYRDQLPPNPAESHTGVIRDSALEMPRRLLLPPPPYCPTNSRIETSLSSRKIRHRRLTTDHRSEPYAVQVRAPPPPSAPPQADYLQFPRNSQISSTADSSHNQISNHLEITSVMANYVANFMNNRAER